MMDDSANSLQSDNSLKHQGKLVAPPSSSFPAASPVAALIHGRSPRIRIKNGTTKYRRQERIPYDDVFAGLPKYSPPSYASVFADGMRQNNTPSEGLSRMSKSDSSEPSQSVLEIHHSVKEGEEEEENARRRLSYDDVFGYSKQVSLVRRASEVLSDLLGVACSSINELQSGNHYTELGEVKLSGLPMTDRSGDKLLTESLISHQTSGYSIQNSHFIAYSVLSARNNNGFDSVKDDNITIASTASGESQSSSNVEGSDRENHCRKYSSLQAQDISSDQVQHGTTATSFSVHKAPSKFEDPGHSQPAQSLQDDIRWVSVNEIKLVTEPTSDPPPSRPPPLPGLRKPSVLHGSRTARLPSPKVTEDVAEKLVKSDSEIQAECIGDVPASITEERIRRNASDRGMVTLAKGGREMTQLNMMNPKERKNEADAGLPQGKHFDKGCEASENSEPVEFDVEREMEGLRPWINSEQRHGLQTESKTSGDGLGGQEKECQGDNFKGTMEGNIPKPRDREKDRPNSELEEEKRRVEIGVADQPSGSCAVHESSARKIQGKHREHDNDEKETSVAKEIMKKEEPKLNDKQSERWKSGDKNEREKGASHPENDGIPRENDVMWNSPETEAGQTEEGNDKQAKRSEAMGAQEKHEKVTNEKGHQKKGVTVRIWSHERDDDGELNGTETVRKEGRGDAGRRERTTTTAVAAAAAAGNHGKAVQALEKRATAMPWEHEAMQQESKNPETRPKRATIFDWAFSDARDNKVRASSGRGTHAAEILETCAVEAAASARHEGSENATQEKAASIGRTSEKQPSPGRSNKTSPYHNEILLSEVSTICAIEAGRGIEEVASARRRAVWERHQRIAERASRALEEKKQRDFEAQKEHAERRRAAEVLDVKIKRWAAGKEGNVRALLSTLQYILWRESGWQPVPLIDLVPAGSVKKAYRKATLCLHPDKVQQKGATIQQKYTAEKVFDLLKEAWSTFASEEMI